MGWVISTCMQVSTPHPGSHVQPPYLKRGPDFHKERRRRLKPTEKGIALPVENVPAGISLPDIRKRIGQRRPHKKVAARQIQHAEDFSFKCLVEPGGFNPTRESPLIPVELLVKRITEHGHVALKGILNGKRIVEIHNNALVRLHVNIQIFGDVAIDTEDRHKEWIFDKGIGAIGVLCLRIRHFSPHAVSAEGLGEICPDDMDAVVDQLRLDRRERTADRQHIQAIVIAHRPIDRSAGVIQLGRERLIAPLALRPFVFCDLKARWRSQRDGAGIEDREPNQGERVIATIVVRPHADRPDPSLLLIARRQQGKIFWGEIIRRVQRISSPPGDVLLADAHVDGAQVQIRVRFQEAALFRLTTIAQILIGKATLDLGISPGSKLGLKFRLKGESRQAVIVVEPF